METFHIDPNIAIVLSHQNVWFCTNCERAYRRFHALYECPYCDGDNLVPAFLIGIEIPQCISPQENLDRLLCNPGLRTALRHAMKVGGF